MTKKTKRSRFSKYRDTLNTAIHFFVYVKKFQAKAIASGYKPGIYPAKQIYQIWPLSVRLFSRL